MLSCGGLVSTRPCGLTCRNLPRLGKKGLQARPKGRTGTVIVPTPFPFSPRICPARSSTCTATSSTSSIPIPESREESIAQAASAIITHTAPTKGAKNKKKKKSPEKGFPVRPPLAKLSVEIPDIDESPQGIARLGLDLAQALHPGPAPIVVLQPTPEALATFPPTPQVTSLTLASAAASSTWLEPDAMVLVVNPTAQDLFYLEDVARSAQSRARALIVVNGGWSPEALPVNFAAFCRTFKTAYAFQPLAIQLLVVTQEGALLRIANEKGTGIDATPWRVVVRKGDGWNQVGQMMRRPTGEELDAILVNAAAAQSPINEGIKGARGFLDKINPLNKT